MRKSLLLVIIFSMLFCLLNADGYVPGNIIVLLYDNVTSNTFADFVNSYDIYDLRLERVLSARLNIMLFSFDDTLLSEESLLLLLKADPNVNLASLNYIFEYTESIPNDPEFYRQWALKNELYDKDIDATFAWDLLDSKNTNNSRFHKVLHFQIIQ